MSPVTAPPDLLALRDQLVEAIARDGDSPASWSRLAVTQAALGDGAAAYASVRRALQSGPLDAEEVLRLGVLLLELQRPDEAATLLREAARAMPDDARAIGKLALAEHALANDEAAHALRAKVRASRPDDLAAALDAALQLPLIPASEAAVRDARARYARGLDEVRAELPRWLRDSDQVFRTGHEHFLLAYQGEDDLELQRDYSSFTAALAQAARPEWREPRALRWDGRRKLRVGFVASTFYDCTAGRYFERWVTGLDGARFERSGYHLGPYSDAFTARIAGACDGFAALPAEPESLAARLAADVLDIIVYPEVGMTPALHVLAVLRLAPLQFVGWGHPVTTGSDAIDGYFTAAAMEPEGAAAHYTETLLPLPGLGVQYAMPSAVEPFARGDLRLPPGATVYACPQSPFKIHPEMDALFAELLARDPQAVLVFFQGFTRGSTERFMARLQAALAARGVAPGGQVKILPRMPGEAFRRALAASDLVLDTLRWSGGNTTLDAIAAGTPVLTVPGRFMRGRQSAAMLAQLGLDSLVVPDARAWVERAHVLAHDREALAGLRGEIAARRGALFDQPGPLAAIEETLLRLAAEKAD